MSTEKQSNTVSKQTFQVGEFPPLLVLCLRAMKKKGKQDETGIKARKDAKIVP